MKYDFFADDQELEEDLNLLERLQRFRVDFADAICEASSSRAASVLTVLRLEVMLPFAEFYFQLRAQGITTAADLERLADLHNAYLVDLMKDAAKVERMGLKTERLMQAIFTGDTLPRLVQSWRETPGAIDQSNLGRLLVVIMSTETTRKLVVASSEAGFLERIRTPFGTVLVRSTGTMESIYGRCLRALRLGVGGIMHQERN